MKFSYKGNPRPLTNTSLLKFLGVDLNQTLHSIWEKKLPATNVFAQDTRFALRSSTKRYNEVLGIITCVTNRWYEISDNAIVNYCRRAIHFVKALKIALSH